MKKYRYKRKNMNQGGVVDTITQLLPTLGVAGQIGSLAMGAVNMIRENRANQALADQQAYMNTTNQYRGFQMGGAVDNQLSNTSVEVQGNPGIDTNPRMVANNAINVTEGEVINNNVNMGNGQGAFVFSDDKSMRDPSNGKTFAKSVKKYERAKGRAEKVLERYPNDQEAKNAIMFNQRMIDQTAQRQEETKSMLGLENDLMGMQQGMRYGGKVNYVRGGQVDPNDPKSRQKAMEDQMFYNRYNGFNPFQLIAGFPRAPMPKMGMGPRYGNPLDLIEYQVDNTPVISEYNNSQTMKGKLRRLSMGDAAGPFGDTSGIDYNIPASSRRSNFKMGGKVNYVDGGVPGSSNTENPDMYVDNTGLPFMTKRLMDANRTLAGNIPEAKLQKVSALGTKMDGVSTKMGVTEKNPGFSTLGDYVYMAGKTAELIGKAAMARQPVTTYNRSDFEVNRPIYNPTADQRTMNDMVRAQTAGINTGNANLDRALASTAYAQGMDKNAQIAEKYRQMQGASDLSVGQTNLNTALMIADRNENNLASKFNAQDAVLTSLGTYGQAIQDMSNTRASNRINLQAINQMSQMYNISPENLLNIMRNNPAIKKQLEELVQLRSRG